MRAAVFQGVGKSFAIEERAIPEPGPGGLVLKVGRCGVCGSDLHMTSGHGPITFPAGKVLGHEYAGEVVAVGPEVDGFRIGDIVTSIPVGGCGRCEACVAGHPALCPNMFGLAGAFAEYVRCLASGSVKLPQTLSMADGALCEPLAVGLHGVALTKMAPGTRVVVLGAGAVALAAIYWARRLGAGKIVAVSRSERRAAMAMAMGASAFVSNGDDEAQRITEALGGAPELILECVGVPGMLDAAVRLSARRGKIVSLGFCSAPDPVFASAATLKEVSLHFSMHFTLRELQHVADTLDAGHLEPRMMVSDTVSLDAFPAAFERLRGPNTDTKVLVSPWKNDND
jgi:threonine dehydrogenase-like Zn-dependent dehydrogenase